MSTQVRTASRSTNHRARCRSSLNLTVADVAPSQVASNVAGRYSVQRSEIGNARCQCLLQVMPPIQVCRHPCVGWTGAGIEVPALGRARNISCRRALDLNTT